MSMSLSGHQDPQQGWAVSSRTARNYCTTKRTLERVGIHVYTVEYTCGWHAIIYCRARAYEDDMNPIGQEDAVVYGGWRCGCGWKVEWSIFVAWNGPVGLVLRPAVPFVREQKDNLYVNIYVSRACLKAATHDIWITENYQSTRWTVL